MIIILIFFLVLISTVILIILINDFNVKSLFPSEFKSKKILFIYPHPDDEILASGGLISALPKNNFFVISVTKGEKGNEKFKLSPKDLGKLRENEFRRAMARLGVKNFEIWDFSDGGINTQSHELFNKISDFIVKNKIDTVATFERTGIYGHQDHVALSKMVNDLNTVSKLFSTLPLKIEKLYNIQGRIKNLDLVKNSNNEPPEFKIFTGFSIIKRYYALKSYRSQHLGHRLPLLLKLILMPFEYYTTNWKKEDVKNI